MFILRSAVNDAGSPGKTGDDRFGVNLAAGSAWVIDGATDAATLEPFPDAESGAAWLAGCLSEGLQDIPRAGETAEAYFLRILTGVREAAAAQSRIPLEALPPEASPVASMMWMRAGAGACEFVWAGDCFAIAERASGETLVIGTEEKADDETLAAVRMLAMAQDARWALLQAQRRAAQAPERGLVTLDPRASAHFGYRRIDLSPGDHVLLVTDGLYRFVVPYGMGSPGDLIGLAREAGLDEAVARLRGHELRPNGLRLKARDDAAGVLLQL